VIGIEQLRAFDDDPGRAFRIVVARKIQEVSTVCGLKQLDLARGDELLPSELSNGLEQTIARARTSAFNLHQGLVG
jgi:ABC-type nitrate/sulfonate/bicarbonate transport system ATPase subunit